MLPDIDDLIGAALQEAYASAPTDEVVLHTLELRHPSFTEGPVRVVRDYGETYIVAGVETDGHYLKLEDDAPAQAGQTVLFQSCLFNLDLPEQKEGALPTLSIELDNVTRQIMEYLDLAIGVKATLDVTYREYVTSNKNEPQFILGGFSMSDVKSNLGRVTGTARFSDLVNKNFPGKLYRPNEFQGLVQ